MNNLLQYYTCVYFDHKTNNIMVRGLDNDMHRHTLTIDNFKPMVWVPLSFNYNKWSRDITNHEGKIWKSLIDNSPLTALTFKDIESCKNFVQQNTKTYKNQDGETVRNTVVHTTPNNCFISQYIAENFQGERHVGSENLKIYSYDIETEIGHRNVPADTLVKCRHIAQSSQYVDPQSSIKTMTIEQFEGIGDIHSWELYDQSSDSWVTYNHHPYRYIGGFPDPLKAEERITLITVKDVSSRRITTWGCEDFVNPRSDVEYRQFSSEEDLLKDFVLFLEQDYPDIITGWNTAVFDNTYVANRIKNVLGTEWMNRLSPFHDIHFKSVKMNEFGKTITETTWEGIANLDYLKLYKKFTYGNRESYKLDDVASDEIGSKKIPNPTGGSFKDFYSGEFDVRTKPNDDDNDIKKLGYIRTQLKDSLKEHPENTEKYNQVNAKLIQMCKQLFIEYNIRDVELVDQIDAKLHFIDLIMVLAYAAHCNYADVFGPVKTWDFLIYNYCNDDHKVIPIQKSGVKSEKYPGAYVKDPLKGKHEYCESFDLDSLYPHLIMQYNISPETLLRNKDGSHVTIPVNLDALVHKKQDTSEAHNLNYSMASSGVCFSKEHQGIMPFLMEKFYAERKMDKKQMLKTKSEHEKIMIELHNRGVEV